MSKAQEAFLPSATQAVKKGTKDSWGQLPARYAASFAVIARAGVGILVK